MASTKFLRYVVVVSTSLLSACATLPGGMEPVSVTVSDLRMGNASFFEQQYFATIRILNPNDREISMNGVSFALDLNDKQFAKGVSGKSVTVPRYGTATVEVEMISSITDILRQLGALTAKTDADMQSFNYRIRGKLNAVGALSGRLPFDERGELKFSEPATKAGTTKPKNLDDNAAVPRGSREESTKTPGEEK